MDEKGLILFLDEHRIVYERIEHPPVYTCAEADHLRPDLNGVSVKNLFLRDEKANRYYVLMTDCAKRADFSRLRKTLGVKGLHMGSEDRLYEYLGVTPGAVTVLGLINDEQKRVELLVDREIWEQEYYLCHPLVNTATLVIPFDSLKSFFNLVNHEPRLVDI